jgi:hypothetical protein
MQHLSSVLSMHCCHSCPFHHAMCYLARRHHASLSLPLPLTHLVLHCCVHLLPLQLPSRVAHNWAPLPSPSCNAISSKAISCLLLPPSPTHSPRSALLRSLAPSAAALPCSTQLGQHGVIVQAGRAAPVQPAVWVVLPPLLPSLCNAPSSKAMSCLLSLLLSLSFTCSVLLRHLLPLQLPSRVAHNWASMVLSSMLGVLSCWYVPDRAWPQQGGMLLPNGLQLWVDRQGVGWSAPK